MRARAKSIIKRALSLQQPGRALKVYSDDTFLVSYPKSGNTWLRFLVANLLFPENPAEFSQINRIIPDPEISSKRDLDKTPRPRIIKSHHYFDPRYKRIIYVVRDPRDVVVSQYHFHRKRRVIEDQYPLDQFVVDFVRGEASPDYGSWFEHVASWLFTRSDDAGFLLLRYEDMLSDTGRQLERIAAFLGVSATAERLSKVVELSSASRMKKLEKLQVQKFSSTRNTRQDIPFVRSAVAGGWKTVLSQSSITTIESAWAPLMQWLGYEPMSGQKDRPPVPSVLKVMLGSDIREGHS